MPSGRVDYLEIEAPPPGAGRRGGRKKVERNMLPKKRPAGDLSPPSAEIVTTEPVLVPPSHFSPKDKVDVFMAVDYLGTRFRIGDHVAMYTGEGREWVCVLETLYKDPKTREAKFKGRWFWSVADILAHKEGRGEVMRPSKCETHELVCCDNRDTNLVESISRKCTILSLDNFLAVKRVVTKQSSAWSKIYFCERQFYHKANRFSELNSILFPGDPIPSELRIAAGLPALQNTSLEENVDYEHAYHEPEYSANAKRREGTPADKSDNIIGGPVLIW